VGCVWKCTYLSQYSSIFIIRDLIIPFEQSKFPMTRFCKRIKVAFDMFRQFMLMYCSRSFRCYSSQHHVYKLQKIILFRCAMLKIRNLILF
jgi:hypothetical protein